MCVRHNHHKKTNADHITDDESSPSTSSAQAFAENRASFAALQCGRGRVTSARRDPSLLPTKKNRTTPHLVPAIYTKVHARNERAAAAQDTRRGENNAAVHCRLPLSLYFSFVPAAAGTQHPSRVRIIQRRICDGWPILCGGPPHAPSLLTLFLSSPPRPPDPRSKTSLRRIETSQLTIVRSDKSASPATAQRAHSSSTALDRRKNCP